ncbi:MAG: Asp-tRNA(Asn)/Glu-tRNA(Gln) amidotransferase subunit GatC [Clostridia bacterium]|nr:Asp-tRNA(Asn)/Glu-tRNA(Gln) amidotransferase subunit GatC [Clostridia bacterium]
MAQATFDIRRLAKLSRLRLDDGEAEKFSADMENIVTMVENLPEFDSTALPLNADDAMVLREDKTAPSMERDRLLQNAPQIEAGCVVVPKIVE